MYCHGCGEKSKILSSIAKPFITIRFLAVLGVLALVAWSLELGWSHFERESNLKKENYSLGIYCCNCNIKGRDSLAWMGYRAEMRGQKVWIPRGTKKDEFEFNCKDCGVTLYLRQDDLWTYTERTTNEGDVH